jgi:hypothetical protein
MFAMLAGPHGVLPAPCGALPASREAIATPRRLAIQRALDPGCPEKAVLITPDRFRIGFYSYARHPSPYKPRPA